MLLIRWITEAVTYAISVPRIVTLTYVGLKIMHDFRSRNQRAIFAISHTK